ncbi:putative glucan endo-1,3-beta-glucosidase A6 [Apium graveolens]|uniref:putative glucan endo-1,3-beta-glucosidase A6 n=1 Tax=Apium graveolens TaxID=4045 RepID=UPI003D7BCFDE
MSNGKRKEMALLPLLLFSLFYFSSAIGTPLTSIVGVNYGRRGNNIQSPYQTIRLLKNMNVTFVKLYDADSETLRLLSKTNIQVSVMVPNEQISNIASNQSQANLWVHDNVLDYYPDTRIRFILVGNEVLSYNTSSDVRVWHDLVPAMQKIKKSLAAKNIRNIKIGTPLAMDMMESTFPPSTGKFRANIIGDVMAPLLHFLNSTKSYFFLDVYPYYAWSKNPTGVSLDYALFQGGNGTAFTDPTSGLNYTNLLDQMLDSVIFAMSNLGYDDIKLAISETGWPHSGDLEEPGANMYNAATYNRNLVKKLTAQKITGTPARPGAVIPTFIFSLYDENRKNGPGTERHWGLRHPTNGRAIYDLDITGARSDYGRALIKPTSSRAYRGKAWCVVARGVNEVEVGSTLGSACSQVEGLCEALRPGRECYEPVSIISHADYAFSSYWASLRNVTGASCYFNGLAVETTTDPSHGSCKVPGVTL